MATQKWHQGRMVAYDCESTGTDVFTDRIVTSAVVHHEPGQRPRTLSWLIDPGVPIPPEASAVHGWTQERLQERLAGHEAMFTHPGRADVPTTRTQALYEITGQLALAMSQGIPVIAANAAFDLSMLEAENTRHGQPTLAERLAPKGVAGVVDVMVIEKQFDVYRKSCYKAPGCRPEDKHHECGGCRGGKYACGGCGVTDRTLSSLCRHYGILLGGAHDASADAVAALRLAGRLAASWPDIARLRLATLHSHQVEWKREQSDGLRKFFTRIGETEKAASVCGEWPLHSACATATAGVA